MGFKQLELERRVAVVIGGTSGIGRAIAHGLAEAGAEVVCSSRREEQVETAAVEIEKIGRKTIRCISDVGDRKSLENLLSETSGALGKVDILVNSAGITKRAPSLELDDEDWAAILETNLNGTFRGWKVFGKDLIANGC